MPMEDGTYWIAKAGDKMAGGIFEMKGSCFENVPVNWMPYLAADDVDARAKKAVAAGATVMKEPFDIPGVGRIVVLRQPGGGTVGWMTPAKS
jgi:predicted enzyme related to lactoylglutathione lyase